MRNLKFYISLNILNILLCLFSYLTLLVFFVIFSIAKNSFIPIFLIFLSIFVKIFILYFLFFIFEKFFPNLEFNNLAKLLKTNSVHRKKSILLAFGYDVIIILYCLLFFSMKEYCFEWVYIPVYEIITFGGVWMFYIALFRLWKNQGKLKQ